MSRLRAIHEKDRFVALLLSDIHLSHRPPIARSLEPDWYAAMARPLHEIERVSQEFRLPIVCAGDVFDDGWRPNRCPPELINFALKNLPDMFSVPGQHDLPHHRYQDLPRSAYWTLVQAGKIENLPPGVPIILGGGDVALYGFPWGFEIEPPENHMGETRTIKLAVIHDYLWKDEHGHKDAPEAHHLRRYKKKLQGYDAAVFGDNHKGFLARFGEKKKEGFHNLLNCGTFYRRTTLERDYRPQVGLLQESGNITIYHPQIDKDCYLDTREVKAIAAVFGKEDEDFDALVNELNQLGDTAINFMEALKHFLNNNQVRTPVKTAILAILEAIHG